MAGYATGAKHAMLAELGTVALYASLHTADPGSTGSDEVTGGSPAYSREAITWHTPATNGASSGEMKASNQPTFDVPAGITITHVGLWSAATSGTYYGNADVANESYSAQGLYSLLDFTLDLNASSA